MAVATPCSDACGCDISSSQPVCGTDGRNYFTPCHAGCRSRFPGASKNIYDSNTIQIPLLPYGKYYY